MARDLLWYTKDTDLYYYDEKEALRYESFFPKFLTHAKGELGGKPLELMDWIKHDIIRPLFGVKRKSDGLRRYRTVYCEVPRKNSKALSVTTPIPTPKGWTTMGDISVGDVVFGIEGKPCRVTHTSEVFHKPCRLVRYDGGAIVATDDHLWRVSYTPRGKMVTLSSAEIEEEILAGQSIYLPPNLGIRTSEHITELNPYDIGRFVTGESIPSRECRERFAAEGVVVGELPRWALRSSYRQRIAILQGLMDSESGRMFKGDCFFSTSYRILSGQICEILTSLGCERTWDAFGSEWHVRFHPYPDIPVFRDTKKSKLYCDIAKNSRMFLAKRIQTALPTTIVPTRCIAVDSQSHCFLAGPDMVATHNTTIAAGVALAVMFLDHEPGAEIYSAAADRDQAAIAFDIARTMIVNNAELDKRSEVYRRAITYPAFNTFYRVISADASTKHGFNAQCVVFDELHAQTDRELWDVLLTSVGSRRQPIIFAITTAGFDKTSICYEQHLYAKKILDGEPIDDSFLPIIYAAEPGDDWTDPAIWRKANPGLGASLKEDYIRQQCKKAQELPSYENTFKRLHLNMWTEQDTRWLSMAAWDECVGRVVYDELRGLECYVGWDLSSTQDLTCVCLLFSLDTIVKVLPFFWLPDKDLTVRAKKDKVPYDAWKRDGFLETSPGQVIDYQRIRMKINDLSKDFRIQECAGDRWNAQSLMTQLDEEDGFKVIPLGQQMSFMSAPSKELERLIINKQIEHGGHPLLREHVNNVTIRSDANGNIRPIKPKDNKRIDGVVAMINGLSRLMLRFNKTTVYKDRGILSV